MIYPVIFYKGYELENHGLTNDGFYKVMAPAYVPVNILHNPTPGDRDEHYGYVPADSSDLIPPPAGFLCKRNKKGGLSQAFVDNLAPEIADMDEFHKLRLMRSEKLPEDKRRKIKWLRDCMPGRGLGLQILKAIDVKYAIKFLDGTYDCIMCGCGFFRGSGYYAGQWISDDLCYQNVENDFNLTPKEVVDLFCPNYNLSEEGLWYFQLRKTDKFSLVPAYGTNMAAAPVGVLSDPDPDFTGNGFVPTHRPVLIPEFALAPEYNGNPAFVSFPEDTWLNNLTISHDRGFSCNTGAIVHNGNWDLKAIKSYYNFLLKSNLFRNRRQQIMKMAIYHGYKVFICSCCDKFYHVAAFGEPLPDGLFIDMDNIGRVEYRGKILKSDSHLKFMDN